MALEKCLKCDLAMDRKGEGRPGIRCKDCRNRHCFKCADLTVDFCDIVRDMGKDIWSCGDCEKKSADIFHLFSPFLRLKSFFDP